MTKKFEMTDGIKKLFFGDREKEPFLTQGMLECIWSAAKGNTSHHYKSAEEMAERIVDYFLECDRDGGRITITGMSMHLGYVSRQSFYDNVTHEMFGPVLKAAHQAIERYYELKLCDGGNAGGPIFALKQFNWRDTQEVTSNVTATISSEPLSADEWAKQYAGGKDNGTT